MRASLTDLKAHYESNRETSLAEFFRFLEFQSISSEPEHRPQVVACAHWLEDYLERLHFDVEFWETPGHPVIFAQNLSAGTDKPTVLIYNHYDVQPVDPLDLWESPPFKPTIRDGEIFARGAQDNKGQCFYVLQALNLLLKKEGGLPLNVKLVIEGEEETGSAGLSALLDRKKKALAADHLAIVDLGIRQPGRPAITLGVRGIVTMDVKVTGSNTDLHSGAHGGIVYNPIHALVEILSKLRDPQGKIAVPGFYDDVAPLAEEEKAQLSFDFSADEYQNAFGASPTGGEKGFTPLERAWIRPALEVNGISGGYAGTGFKTVIPAVAKAKVSCRTVPNQDPLVVGKMVARRIKELAPEGIAVEVDLHEGVGSAVRSDLHSKTVQAFSQAYREVFGSPAEYIFEGGSIPIINELSRASGAPVVLVGLGLPGDNMHAPNEHFGIDRLEKGSLIMARALQILGG